MLIFIPFLVFSMKYQNAAIERYFLGSFLIELIWIVIFIDKITKKFLVYFAFIVLIILAVIFNINRNIKNIDQSKNTHAYTWALETLKKQKVEGVRGDVLIINASKQDWKSLAKEFEGKRPVYFIE